MFAGDFEVVELPTLEVEVDGERRVAVNDVVVTSATRPHGRARLGGRRRGPRAAGCDGVVCSTPSGSTAYNLSNGGPVLVWGLDALVVTFIAAHSLHARPLVVPRGRDYRLEPHAGRGRAALVDGHRSRTCRPAAASWRGSARSTRCSRRCPR